MKCTRTDTEAESRLTLEGSLDAHTAPELRAILAELDASPAPAKHVVIDIGQLSMIDSSGIGVLVALSKRLRSAGKTLHVINVHDQPLMVIKLLKLETLFGMAS